MSRKLVVFGNGIGMQIDPDYYCLERSLKKAWDDGDLSDDQKELLSSCLNDGVIEGDLCPPTKEDELADLQRVLNSCDTIKKFEKRVAGDEGWLTDKGMEFPDAIRKYFHQTVCNFYDSNYTLPEEFQKNLRNFVIKTGSHITTLNYDDLLYDSFTDTAVFKKRHLRDGFFKLGFDFDRAEKLYDSSRKEGWFLHLHGSPLFVNKAESSIKIKRSGFAKNIGTESRHLVLTNVAFKKSTIAGSEILSAYWKKLDELIIGVSEITLFGYGGLDTHLNNLIYSASAFHDIPVRIIEKNLGETDKARILFWAEAVGEESHINIIQKDNILEFTEW